MSLSPENQKIINFVVDNPNQFTVREIADRFGVTVVKIKSLKSRNPEIVDFFLNTRESDTIKAASTLKGENVMADVVKTPTKQQLNAFEQHCREQNLPFEQWRAYWHKTHEYSSFFVNPIAEKEQEDYKQKLLTDIRAHAPKYRKRKVDPTGEHLLVLPMADIHFGKWASKEETGKVYNMEVTEKRAREGTDALVSKAKAFGVSNYAVCLGNDMLHTDNGKTTTSGTPQDNDGSWFENFRVAKKVMVSIIEQLANHGDVHLMFVPANHDWRSGFALAECIAAFFHNHPNVHVGKNNENVTERHRKYLVFGHNLIMLTHGDGAKEKDLHWHLATETAEVWSKTTFRYVYCGHIHHKDRKVKGHSNTLLEKDKIGVTEIHTGNIGEPTRDVYIEYVRSQAGTDGWHDRNGYTSRQATEAFLHHPTGGQVARFTHFF